MPFHFEISEQESAILGIRVARAGSLPDDINSLQQALRDLRVDVLKLGLGNAPRDLYVQLDRLGYPYYVLGMTMTYRFDLAGAQPRAYFRKDLEFVEHTGQYEREVRALVKDIFAGSATSYYLNPGLIDRVPETAQLECLAAYIAGMHSAANPDYYCFLLKTNNRFSGMVCGRKFGTGGEVTYAGVISELQSKGLFIDIARFIRNHGISLGREFGIAHVQLHNSVMHRVLHHEGMYPVGHVLNVHVNCFQDRQEHSK